MATKVRQPNWRRFAKTRFAAMSLSCEAGLRFFRMYEASIKVLIANDIVSEEEVYGKSTQSENGEIIWDKLCKSGIQSRARTAIGECLEIVAGYKIVSDYERPSIKICRFGSRWYDLGKEVALLPITHLKNSLGHSYFIGETCIVHRLGGGRYALRSDGKHGNNPPHSMGTSLTLSGIPDMERFFSSITGVKKLRDLRWWFGDSTLRRQYQNLDKCGASILQYEKEHALMIKDKIIK